MREEHEGARKGPVEDLARALGRDHGGHRPELLASLDGVEPLKVVRRPGIGQKAPAAEGAGPPLAPALEPTHHRPAHEGVGHRTRQVAGTLVGHLGRREQLLDLAVVPAATEGGALHGAHLVAEATGQVQRAAEGRAGVTGRRLDPDVVEGALGHQAGVGHAVERHAARHGEAVVARPSVQPAGQVEQDLLQAQLNRSSQVGVILSPGLLPVPSLHETAPVHGLHAEPSVTGGTDQAAKIVDQGRPPVGGHGHDLVLVGRSPKAEVLGDLLVEKAEGMRKALGAQHLQLAPSGSARQMGGHLPPAVEDEHARAGVGRGQVGRRSVGEVMRHEAHEARIETGQCGKEE